MKSLTVTTHRAINYGAVLQTFALQRKQESLGIENEVIDTPKTNSIYEKLPKQFSRSFIISVIINIFSFFHKKKAKRLINGFNNFVDKNIKLTSKIYNNSSKIEIDKDVSFFITGSDQVFSLRDDKVKLRMLDFYSNNIKKYSYAASLGEYDWSDLEIKNAKRILTSYNKISVREHYTKNYLEEKLNLPCCVNIDPVFLMEQKQWLDIAEKPFYNEKYILCYNLVSNKNMQNVLNILKKIYNYKIVCLQTNFIKRIKADKYVFDASPTEFLGWIANSEGVVTTSFHGTAFSIIFNKPFYTLIKDYKSQRITGLLDIMNLSDRCIKDTDSVSELNLNVDFSYSANSIKKEQKMSEHYFYNIINQVK